MSTSARRPEDVGAGSDLDDAPANVAIGTGRRGLAPSWNVLTLWTMPTVELTNPELPDGAADVLVTSDWALDERRLMGICREVGIAPEKARARFAAGGRLAILRCGGPVAASGWINHSRAWIGEIATGFAPPRGHAYVWDCLTQPTYRGHGFYPLLLWCIARRLREAGVSWVWIGVEWANWRSISGIIHAGFRPVGTVVAVRSGRLALRKLIENPGASEDSRRVLRQALAS